MGGRVDLDAGGESAVHQCRGERNDCHAHREPGRTQRVYSVRVSASAQGDSDKEFGSTILKACATIIGETLLHMSLHVQVFGRRHDEPSTRCGGRRPKSAKARSRGKFGTGGAAGAMGI